MVQMSLFNWLKNSLTAASSLSSRSQVILSASIADRVKISFADIFILLLYANLYTFENNKTKNNMHFAHIVFFNLNIFQDIHHR